MGELLCGGGGDVKGRGGNPLPLHLPHRDVLMSPTSPEGEIMIIDMHAHVTAPDSLYVYKAGLLSHRGGHGRGGTNATDEDILKALNAPVFGGSSHLEQLKEA